ncbi:MAG: LLM class flavin-dependent oxidoreductase, partial [Chloroflexi bacterium]|nr:LLM class flavin-dependent oxidoreductase [Chloroflexota bacterium]
MRSTPRRRLQNTYCATISGPSATIVGSVWAPRGQPGRSRRGWRARGTLAALARETRHIRLGTLVTPATFRLPGPLAVTVAQVDQISGGRVELGLG